MTHSIIKRAMIVPLLMATFISLAQTNTTAEKPKVSAKLIGTVAIAYNPASNSEYYNMGGPGIRLDYKKCFIGLSFYPSVRYFNGDMNSATDVYKTKQRGTILTGFGPQIGYRKLAFVFPFYCLPNNCWVMAVGVGYKI